MTRDETDDMPRLLLALSLFAFAAIALAGEPPATEDTTDAKPGKPAVTTPAVDADAPAPAHVSPAPSRSGSATRTAVPRWHSLLPGMIR
jgi:hypothetical protein